MAGRKNTAIGNRQLVIGQTGKSNTKPNRKTNTPQQSRKAALTKPRRRGGQFLRFREARGKTVDFVEMYTNADFPCLEIAFADKTALLVSIDTRLVMEPVYSDWKTGNERRLRTWPARETS